MHIGYLTSCLKNIPFKEKVKIAKEYGFKSIEISCRPNTNLGNYPPSDIDVANLTQEEAIEIKSYMNELGISISSLDYYENNLHNDLEKRVHINAHLKKCIDAAVLLDVPSVGTFVGRNIDKSLIDNFDEFEVVFKDLVSYAEERNIKIVIENCQKIGWQREGEPGTISFTPELWREMFKRVPNKNFGLTYDPSHLHVMLIDYISPIYEFKDRIFHVHAKDAEVFQDKLKAYGVFNKQLKSIDDPGYWRYRMPGLGQVDWTKLITILKDINYNGVISIEHEDPLYEGSDEKVKEGLKLGIDFLQKLI